MPKYLLHWPGRQGVRENYFTAKGFRSAKSLGTAALKNKLAFSTLNLTPQIKRFNSRYMHAADQ